MKDARVRFDTQTPFILALRGRVDTYFDERGRSRTGGGGMVLKTATLFAWLLLSYAGALALGGSWLAVLAFGVSCGLAMAGLGMAVQHERQMQLVDDVLPHLVDGEHLRRHAHVGHLAVEAAELQGVARVPDERAGR